MTWKTARFVLSIGLLSILVSVAAANSSPVRAQNPGTSIDIAVVLDDSASMSDSWTLDRSSASPTYYPPTDPNGLRYSAARLLVHLLEPQDRVFLVSFGSAVHSLVGQDSCSGSDRAKVEALEGCRMSTVGDRDSVKTLVSALEPPSGANQGTRIDLGYALASQVLRANRQTGRPQYILLLTDGKPTGGGAGDPMSQRAYLKMRAPEDRKQGLYAFVIGLCNPQADCGKHLEDALLTDIAGSVDRYQKATSADDLVRIFSEILSRIKPGLYVSELESKPGEPRRLWTEEEQSVVGLNLVVAGQNLAELRCGDTPVWRRGEVSLAGNWAPYAFPDDNFLLLALGSGSPMVCQPWEIRGADAGKQAAFAVIESSTYPVITFPPPAEDGDPSAPHYFPAGKDLLVVAQVLRTGTLVADARVTLNTRQGGDQTLSGNLSQQKNRYWGRIAATAVPASKPVDIQIRVGTSQRPLQLARVYRGQALDGLPALQVLSPTLEDPGLVDESHARLTAAFPAGSDVSDLSMQAYVLDTTNPEDPQPAYEKDLACQEQTCTDQDFVPEPGHNYTVYFLASARSQGRRFGDWAEATLAMQPRVIIHDLPSPIDIGQMRDGGWKLEVTIASAKSLGQLVAHLDLRRADGTVEPGVQAHLSVAADKPGKQEAWLTITGYEDLGASLYEGDLTFSLEGGAQAEIMPPTKKVMLDLTNMHAELLKTTVNFGSVPYWQEGDALPEALVQTLPLRFREDQFSIYADAEAKAGQCPGIQIETLPAIASPEERLDELPVQLSFTKQLAPGECSGIIRLRAPFKHATLAPESTLPWTLSIADPVVDMQPLETVDFGDLWKDGQKSTRVLQVTFFGRSYRLASQLEVKPDSRGFVVPPTALIMTPGKVECNRAKNDLQECEVPLILEMSQSELPRGRYVGEILLTVAGLSKPEFRVPFSFRRSTLAERLASKAAAVVRTVCWFPWAILTWPLFLCLAFLSRVAWNRVRDDEPIPRSESSSGSDSDESSPDGGLPPSSLVIRGASRTAHMDTWSAGTPPAAGNSRATGGSKSRSTGSWNAPSATQTNRTQPPGRSNWGAPSSSGSARGRTALTSSHGMPTRPQSGSTSSSGTSSTRATKTRDSGGWGRPG